MNGQVSQQPPMEGRTFATAAYWCNEGYVLKGASSRVCRNGVWGGDAPSCNGENYET